MNGFQTTSGVASLWDDRVALTTVPIVSHQTVNRSNSDFETVWWDLKEKYFAVILRQEQGWFDANNAYEFSTKVQAQFEQITLGVGEKFGLTLQAISQIIVGLIIAFYKSFG